MQLEPLKTFRQTTNAVYVLHHEGRRFLVKRYNGDDARRRRDKERSTLEIWTELGLSVPSVQHIEVPELRNESYLVMDYAGDSTLQEWLKDSEVSPHGKLERLARIFQESRRRHQAAISRHEPRLLHADANTSNILCVGERSIFIDFESRVECDDLNEAAAIETAKFCRWAARDMGIDHLPGIVSTLVQAYGDERERLWLIVRRTCNRSFQFFHRWRDARRKARQPGEVTKYDVADALARELRQPR
jgi:Ser/Thr protein kinase RdoA (MazF antagonist)